MANSSLWALLSITVAYFLVSRVSEYSSSKSYFITAGTIYIFITLFRILFHVFLYPNFFSPFKDLPTVKGGSLLNGQLETLLREPQGDPFRRWMNQIPNNGFIRYTHLFNKERLFVTSPEAMSDVLVRKSYDFVKQPFLKYSFGKVVGVGVLLAEGDDHKIQRKNLTPAFTFRHIKSLYPIFWSKAIETSEALHNILEENPYEVINIGAWLSRTALDIIGVAGIGLDFGAIKNPENELANKYASVFTVKDPLAKVIEYIAEFIDLRIVLALPLERNKRLATAAAYIRDFCRQVVRQKAENLQREKNEKGTTNGNDICAIAFESGAFSEEGMVDQMMTFLAAGHETTATSLQWAIYMLCKNPAMQRRLREEVLSVVSSPGTNEPPLNSIDSLPYLNAICQETLRFYPPLPISIRQAVRNTTILNRFIPAGTLVLTSAWASNHSTELWGADADVFNPDRWIGPGKANTGGAESNYAFLTFLNGPRNCIGMGFAKGEFLSVLAVLVGRFEFELEYPDCDVKIEDSITNGPEGGLKVRMKVLGVS
ncbi:cytochrome P450 [Lepidopterella palustris CBS 459.81]|uniref:Cytochrome P450 n=1 Tax=Lepidopterella palustris CBS 459.81 TaxID=1314670 RepID=A0A8E2E3S2_9PEZI|nr:cytochrome P450 [Lepidopterella palustris CBS 459.81]